MRIFRPRWEALSDEELCARLPEDDGVFDLLYDRYSQRLFQYLLRMLNGRRDRAEDLLQEVFVQLYEKAANFDPQRRFSTWIFAIAHHKICNEYRAGAARQRAENRSPAPTAPLAIDEAYEKSAFREELLAALADLPEDRRSAFLLRFQEGFSLAEIARVQGCPVGTVKSRLFYTCRLLADHLRDFDHQETTP